MKAETVKSLSHEAGYVIGVTIVLIALSVVVFPLFILLLPVALLSGSTSIWHLDHPNNKS